MQSFDEQSFCDINTCICQIGIVIIRAEHNKNEEGHAPTYCRELDGWFNATLTDKVITYVGNIRFLAFSHQY